MHSTRRTISTSIFIEYYSPSEKITSRCVLLYLRPREEWSNFKVASEMDLVKVQVQKAIKNRSNFGKTLDRSVKFKMWSNL